MTRPLSSVDAAWLRMEEPANLMMVTGLLFFEDSIDFGRLEATVRERLLTFDRFREVVVRPPLGLGRPRWRPDPDFRLDDHLVRLPLAAPGDRAALEDVISGLMSSPLDPSRPLWQLHLIEGFREGPVLLARIHHCIADGIALIELLLSLTDPDTGEAGRGSPSRLAPPGRSHRAKVGPRRLIRGAARVISLAATLAQLAFLPADPATALRGRLGVAKRACWSRRFDLDAVRRAGAAHGATINDVLIAAVAGALRGYLVDRGESVAGLEVRAAVPVNLRPRSRGLELGNNFGLVFLSLPLGIADPVARLGEVKARMDTLKASAQAVVAYAVLHAVGLLPAPAWSALVALFGSKASAVLTNVPGPRRPLRLAGSRIANAMFWVPQSGRLGLGVSILSYAGGVTLGVAVDEGLIADPASLVRGFESELALLTGLPVPPG